MKLHRNIDHDSQMTSIDFEVTRSKVKVTGQGTFTGNRKWFPDDNSRMHMPGIMKFHRDIGHDRQMTPIDFQVTRSKVKVAMTLSSKMVDWK